MPTNFNHYRLISVPVRWAIILDYACMVTLLSLAPSEIFKKGAKIIDFPYADKVAHFGIYLLFGMLMLWAFRDAKSIASRILITITLVCLFGVIMEFLQPILTAGNRFFSWQDMIANAGGTLTGIFLFYLLSRIKCLLSAPSAVYQGKDSKKYAPSP